MNRTRVAGILLPLCLAFGAYSGCSGTDPAPADFSPPTDGGGGGTVDDAGTDTSAGGTDGGSQGGSGGESQGGTGGGLSGGSGGGTAGDANLPDADFGYDAPLYEAGEACATASVEASLKPLDLYIMADRSGSMDGNRWTQQSNALNAFFDDPASANIGVGLRWFPLNDSCSPTSPNCNGDTYVNPLVAWGALPGNAPALVNSVNSATPNGCFTPTQEALNGVLKGSLARQLAQPDHVVVAVLVSDGTPCCSDCPAESASPLGNIAAAYYTGTPSIRTFTIYVASSASAVLTTIAQQGGTGQSFNATSGSAAFLAALKAIQGTAIPCDFDMPDSTGGAIDYDQVSLEYYPGGSTTPEVVPRVADAAACGAGEGWFYDNPADPQKIIMCAATCNKMKADPDAKMSVELGCLGG